MARRKRIFPKDFIPRRKHSLMGIWLVLYLISHLVTNSEAALFVGEDGSGFVRLVNAINNLPYLPVIELGLLAVPFAIHMGWGVRFLLTSKQNAVGGAMDQPRLRRLPGNHAYSWMRWTSWILLVGVILHVLQMRFLDRPKEVDIGGTQRLYVSKVSLDKGLYTVSDRLGILLLSPQAVKEQLDHYATGPTEKQIEMAIVRMPDRTPETYNPVLAERLAELQNMATQRRLLEVLKTTKLKEGQVLALSNEFGKALLLVVRGVFKDPWMLSLYSIFVLAAVYHGFRGLWSFAIVWGFTVTRRSQRWLSHVSVGFMVLLGFLGLSAVWLTYWVNLRS